MGWLVLLRMVRTSLLWLMVRICIKEVGFQKTNHLRNPLNENKQLRISRDGQEVPSDIAIQLCKILDAGDPYDISCANLTMKGGLHPAPRKEVR